MAISKREHDRIVSDLNQRLIETQAALVTPESDIRRTGRIAGVESKYVLRVWYRFSGHAFAVLVHVHPGQSDMAIFAGDLAELAKGYAHRSNCEARAIHDMATEAASAHRRSLMAEIAA